MVSPKKMLAIVIAVVIGMLFLQPVVSAIDTNTGMQSVENESVTANVGTYVDLGGYEIEQGSELVKAPDGTVATEGTDYEMAYGNGSIKVLSGSTVLNDSDQLDVSYDYQATDGTTSMLAGYIPVIMGVLLLVVVSREIQRQM